MASKRKHGMKQTLQFYKEHPEERDTDDDTEQDIVPRRKSKSKYVPDRTESNNIREHRVLASESSPLRETMKHKTSKQYSEDTVKEHLGKGSLSDSKTDSDSDCYLGHAHITKCKKPNISRSKSKSISSVQTSEFANFGDSHSSKNESDFEGQEGSSLTEEDTSEKERHTENDINKFSKLVRTFN